MMNEWIDFFNNILVGAFGCILSIVFSVDLKKRKILNFTLLTTAFILILQGVISIFFGSDIIRKCYPIIAHIPIILILWYVTKRFLWSVTSVLAAYLCCQLRRWLALLVNQIIIGDEISFIIIQIVLTVPLIIVLIYYVAPSMRQLSKQNNQELIQFMSIGFIYYIFDYATTVYTNMLYSGNKLVVEFMPFICCIVYFSFVLYNSAKEKERFYLEMERNSLNLQTKQSLKELEALRQSQKQVVEYRHDLRHHLQYLVECMENGEVDQGIAYAKYICKEIEAQKVIAYCENETVNLILSAFAKKAESEEIEMEVRVSLPEQIMVSPNDLCILLSNALENALHECQYIKKWNHVCKIKVQGFMKSGKIHLEIWNTCRKDTILENGVLITQTKDGHGIGMRSIQTVVERYQGIYSFQQKGEVFLMRVCI